MKRPTDDQILTALLVRNANPTPGIAIGGISPPSGRAFAHCSTTWRTAMTETKFGSDRGQMKGMQLGRTRGPSRLSDVPIAIGVL